MTVLSAKNTPRNSYTATAGQTAFTIGFEFFSVNDVKVYKNGTLMTYDASPSTNTTYKITGTASASDDAYEFGAGGTVTFGSGVALNDSIVIIRDITIERTTDFNPSGAFDISTLNTQLDTIMSIMADTQEQTNRSVKLSDTDVTSATVTLPTNANRASKVLSFDASGNAEATLTTTGLSTLSGITSDITTVAGIASNVTSVAGNASNINSVAGNATNINTVASNATNISAVNSNSSNINTVAGISSNVTTVAGISSDVTSVAGISSNVTTVAADATDIGLVAGSISNVNTVASGISNINTVATNISNVNTVAGVSANVTTVAGSIANVNTVATNITGVNSFADRYRVGSSDPTTSLDAGDLFFNTTSNNLKYYDSSSWNVIASTFSIDAASDTNLTSVADGAMLLYDTGTSKWIDNVMSGDATMADTGAVTIADDAVTYAKIQNVSATDRILGRDSAGAGVIEEITPANLRTMINVADGANAYTHPNHTGEVTSNADGATVIADNVVDEANLKVSNSPVNGYMLTAQSGATGGLTWAEAPSGGGFSLGTALTGTTPTIDWSSATAFSHTLSGDTTYSFSNVPSGGEIELFLKNVGKQYNLESPTSLSSVSFSEFSSTVHHTVFFNNDGSKMYVAAVTGTYPIYQYSLSTNYDISTKTYDNVSNAGNTISAWGYGAKSFNDDGTKMIVVFDSNLYEYSLTTAYDISTLSTTANHTVSVTSLFRTPVAGTSTPSCRSLKFFADGYGLFIGNETHLQMSGHDVPMAITVTLSTAYDISSTLTLDSYLHEFEFNTLRYFTGADLLSGGILTSISDDGYVFSILSKSPKTSTDKFSLMKVFLTTPFDFGTAQIASNIQLDLSGITTLYQGEILPSGKTFRYLDSSGRGVSKRLDISGDYTIAFPSATSQVPATIGRGPDPSTTSYIRMVSLDGTNVLITDHKEIV